MHGIEIPKYSNCGRQKREKREKGYPNRYDQNSIAMRSNVERVGNLRRQSCTLILTSIEREKRS